MSTEVNLRRAAWLVCATGAGLAALLPNRTNAQSPYPEPSGIVISLPLANAAPSSARVAPPALPSRARTLPKPLPGVEYTSLPADDRSTDPPETGSLPGSGALGTPAHSGFASLVSQGAITLRDAAPTHCLPGNLLAIVADIAARFGPVTIESTHRSTGRNWRAGGARHSLHLSCRAVDLRVRAPGRGIMAYLSARPEVGGLKRYRNGIIHIDNGERRSW